MGLVTSLHRRVRRTVPALVVAFLAMLTIGLLGSPTAHAVNTLVSSDPVDNASLPASPTSMLFTFAEPLGPDNTAAATCNGEGFPVGNAAVNADGLSLTVSVPNPMPRGTCNVVVLVSALDSSSNGSVTISFTITADAAAVAPTVAPTVDPATGSTVVTETTVPTTTTPTAASDGEAATAPKVGGPLGLSRMIAALGLAVLLGSIVLIVTAWPEGVEYILTVRFLRIVWVIALIGSIATAIFLTAQIGGTSAGSAIMPTEWTELANTGPGIAALARVALAGACGWVVVRPERCLDQQTQLPALVLPVAAVATFGFSRTSGDLAVIGVFAGVAHAIAMAIWLGGVVLLTRVVLAGPGEDDLVHAVRGFSRISTPALLVTIVTGAVMTYRLDRNSLFDTGHGRVVLLKVVVVAAMVVVGLATRQFVRTRLRKVDAMTIPLASRLRRATGIEAAGGVVALALSSWLLALSPAGLVHVESIEYGNEARIVADDLDVTVFVTGEVGLNGVRIEVDQPTTGLSGLIITFIPPEPAVAARVVLTAPAAMTGTSVAVLDQEIEGVPLSVAGVWTLQIDATTPTGVKTAQKTFSLVD
jgi:putative copper export protein/methionine-rich copper-binding protein CopC